MQTRKTTAKKRGKLISRNSFTQWFNIPITKYSWIHVLLKILEIIDESQKNLVGIPTKILTSQLLDALNYQTCLFIDDKTLSS